PRRAPRGVPRPAPAPAPPPPAPGDGLTLFSYPLLVDAGRLARGADELHAALGEPAFLELGIADAERLGLADGSPARVRTAAGEATLPVRVREHVAPGTAFVPFNNPGLRANTLLAGSHAIGVEVAAAEAAVVGGDA
ncbi:MAG: molybdopterin dinucleotide binding domain-containing protein, partial [Actinomycetota bacterium]